jgi:hypothetical protein
MPERHSPIRTAADEVDYFEAVPFVEMGRGPLIPRNNVKIQFHRDSVSLHAEGLHQRGKSEGCRRIGEIALFPIDLNFH